MLLVEQISAAMSASASPSLAATPSIGRKLRYYLPGLQWLPRYDRSHFGGDLLAAISVSVIMVPQAIAYASLLHLPPVNGLYTSFWPLVVYAFLGTSRQLSIGPEGSSSILLGQVAYQLADAATTGDGPPDPALVLRYVCTITLVAGILTLALGLLRLGFIDSVLSAPVLAGFLQAIALILIVDQTPKLLGIPSCPPAICAADAGTIDKLEWILNTIEEARPFTTAISLGCIAFLLGMTWLKGRYPTYRPLQVVPQFAVVVALVTAFSWAFDFAQYDVDLVGHVQTGLELPSFPLHSTKDVSLVLPAAATVTVLGFVHTQLASKKFGHKHGYTVSPNRELVALGVSQIVSSIFGGWTAYGSYLRTKVADAAGGMTPLAGLLTAMLNLVFIMFILPLFAFMPKCVTAAIIFSVALSLLDTAELNFIFNIRQWIDASLFVSMTIVTVILGIDVGVLYAFACCLLLMVRHTTLPGVTILGRVTDGDAFSDVRTLQRGDRPVQGMIIYKIEGPLHFANSAKLLESTRRFEYYGEVHTHPSAELAPIALRHVLFDFSSVSTIDSTAAQMLMDIIAHYHKRRIRVAVSGLPPALYQLCERALILDLLDAVPGGSVTNVFATMRDAVIELERQSVATPETPQLNRAVMDASLPFADVPIIGVRKDRQQRGGGRNRSNSLGTGYSSNSNSSSYNDDVILSAADDTTPLLASSSSTPSLSKSAASSLLRHPNSVHIRVKERSHAETPVVGGQTNVVLMEALGLNRSGATAATGMSASTHSNSATIAAAPITSATRSSDL